MIRRVLLGLVGLLVIAALAYLLRGFVRSYVLVPILYILWVVRVIYHFFPAVFYWIGLLVILLFLANRSLTKKRERLPRRPLLERENRNPIEDWAYAIENRSQGDYYRWRLANQFANLSLQVLAHRYQSSPEVIREQLRAGTIDVPADIRDYLLAGLARPELEEAPGLLDRVFQSSTRSELDLPPTRMVEFLEGSQEIR